MYVNRYWFHTHIPHHPGSSPETARPLHSSLRVFLACFSRNGHSVHSVTSASNLGVIFKLVITSLLAPGLGLRSLFHFFFLLLPD